MSYLLDTNACIGYLNGRATGVLERMRATPAADITMCAVVKAEMFYGAMRSQHPQRSLAKQRAFLDLFTSIPFDDRAAEVYGRIRAQLATQGTPIGPNDLMIGAIAVANNLTLVTHNTKEFGRVDGLDIEDWEA